MSVVGHEARTAACGADSDEADGSSGYRPLRKDAARNRELLVAAGRAVFAERGLDASLDDVARHAGVGVATAYRHFANKHDLARAIFGQVIDEMITFAEDMASSEDPWQGLTRFVEKAAAQQSVDRGLRDVMSGVHDPAVMEQIAGRMGAPVNRLVARCKSSGQLRPEIVGTDIWLVVVMLCAVADTTMDERPDLWRRYVPILLDSLRSGSHSPLPVPPIDEDSLRAAVARHKHTARGCVDPNAAVEGLITRRP